MTAHDPRYLAATLDDMLLDFHASRYQAKRMKGENVEEFEDDPELSLDRILESLEDGSWEEIQDGFEYPEAEQPG